VAKLGKVMNKVQIFEKWTRRVVAILFVLVGVYFIYRMFI
jgi:threonine/homoserine/homoserine lactone efflux protein